MAAVPSIGRAVRIEGAPAPEADLTRALYEQYANQIFRYCLHQLGSREEAEDAVQSTFLNAFRGIKRGVVPELESAWLFKIAHNVCLSRRRTSWRRGRIESPTDFDVVEEVMPAPSRRSDELMGLQDVLEQMPENQRRAILLREWQGLSYREISNELELSQAAVETLIFRARRALAAGLEQPPEQKKRKLARGADLGNILAGLKSLLIGGSAAAKVAATVAVVSASTVVAAAPIQHYQARSHRPLAPARPAHAAAKAPRSTATVGVTAPASPSAAVQHTPAKARTQLAGAGRVRIHRFSASHTVATPDESTFTGASEPLPVAADPATPTPTPVPVPVAAITQPEPAAAADKPRGEGESKKAPAAGETPPAAASPSAQPAEKATGKGEDAKHQNWKHEGRPKAATPITPPVVPTAAVQPVQPAATPTPAVQTVTNAKQATPVPTSTPASTTPVPPSPGRDPKRGRWDRTGSYATLTTTTSQVPAAPATANNAAATGQASAQAGNGKAKDAERNKQGD